VTKTRFIRRQGFSVYQLRSEALVVSVIPALGAKIVGIESRRTRRHWMWHPAGRLRLFRNRPGDLFAASTLAGADDCLPTVVPCRLGRRAIPDHGESWTARWAVDRRAWARGELRTSLTLPLSRLHIDRTLTLDGPRLLLSYVLTNESSRRQPYLWAFHPLFTMEAGDRLAIRGLSPAFRLEKAHGLGAIRPGTWRWPNPRAGVRLDRLDLGRDDSYVKLFAKPSGRGPVKMTLRKPGEALSVGFDPHEIPVLGLWISRGGWRGHQQLAIQPTNGGADSLSTLVEQGKADWLEAGAARRFVVEISLTTR
jgi:galactose mutarotase-like enzyme